jgi:hypothetical protein
MPECEICNKKWCFHLMGQAQRKAMFARKRKMSQETVVVNNDYKLLYINADERFIANGNKICHGYWSLPSQEELYENYKKLNTRQ